MIRLKLLSVLILFSVHIIYAQEKSIVPGMKITGSLKIRKADYAFERKHGDSAALILIEGDNIIVDFSGATITGSREARFPDEFSGLAVLVRKGQNVTIRNLSIRGYKIAFRAEQVHGLVLEHCDFSYNYRPRLNSTQEKEDVSDWMSFHHNEKEEWLRYGAAIYLSDCDFSQIRNCTVTGGQNALLMTQCDNGKIYNNDFSFNSGIGIGMYRCSKNEISFNKVNFNVRGYSHGVYNRGQDSAGILVYEQSSQNIFYKNSVTHGGDGFFLWAGQTTMDSGAGGCNDNLILENDFSYAPTNGIEVTFSRNRIIGNRIFECDHGIWGGYSYSSQVRGNQFRDNRIGIAIEHGQNNEISGNLFSKDKEAIKLWARKEQPSDWGYAKSRNTRSIGYRISKNSFNGNPVVFNISRSDSLHVWANTFSGCGNHFKTDTTVFGIDSSESYPEFAEKEMVYPSVKNPVNPFMGNGRFAGRKNIRITEWGPYDFRYPIIWNTNPVDKGDTMRFDLLGPAGKWKIVTSKGVDYLSHSNGNFPTTITAIKKRDVRTDILIELEYTGAAFTSPFGKKNAKGKPWRFYFRKYFQPIEWDVLHYPMDTSSHNPVTTGVLFSQWERKAPFKSEKVKVLDYAWWGGIKTADQQHKQFITVANGTAAFQQGEYELSVTWDDAIRVYVDEKKVLDEWMPSRYIFDESPHKKIKLNLGGTHNFRVEHLELGGFASLVLKIKPVE